MKVDRWDSKQDGQLTEQRLQAKLEALGYEVTRYLYPPGTYFSLHTHSEDKIDAVLSGQFRISMAGQSVILGPGDSIHVPKGVEHSAEVVGNDAVVSLDAVKTR